MKNLWLETSLMPTYSDDYQGLVNPQTREKDSEG